MTITTDHTDTDEEVTAPPSISDGLRSLADFYDQHPDLPAPTVRLFVNKYDEKAPAQIVDLIDDLPGGVNDLNLDNSSLGPRYLDGHRSFGDIDLQFIVDIELVTEECTEVREVTERQTLTSAELRRRAQPAVDDDVVVGGEF